MMKAAIEPNPTREFIFGDPFLNAIRPSKSKSAKYHQKGIFCENYLVLQNKNRQMEPKTHLFLVQEELPKPNHLSHTNYEVVPKTTLGK